MTTKLNFDFVDVAIEQLDKRKEKINQRILLQNNFLADLDTKIQSDSLFKEFAEKLLHNKGFEEWKNILLEMYNINKFV